MLLTKGNRIGPYTVIDRIGAGGVAEVYRVKRDGAEFALKILLHRWLEDDSSIIRFEREIGILRQLDNEHIIYLIYWGQYEERPYFVMPLLQGGSLREKINALPPNQYFAQDEMLDIVRSLVAALDHAHSHNVNHYDVKPENILFNEEGNLFLSDFGLALIEGNSENTTSRAGTASYMAPEQFVKARADLDCRADIYALGVITYELLAGKRPWELTKNIDRAKIPDIRIIRPDLSVNMQPVLEYALTVEPQNRYASVTDFLSDLEKALIELPASSGNVHQPAIFVSKVTGLKSEWPVLDNDYELTEFPIDEGGMGMVYKVRQRVDGQIRVIKALMHPTIPLQALFRREVEIALSLKHNHIAPVLRYGFYQGALAFVMPYLGGGSLSERIAQKNLDGKQFTLPEIKTILRPILQALAYAHLQGVKHLDLKPKNILFDDQNNPYLIDFGIASDREVTAIDLGEQARLGTWAYMSPEQIFRADRSKIDQRSDIYSIGLILYELLTGTRYYQGSNAEIEARHRIDVVPDVTQFRPDIHQGVQRILKKCLAKYPQDRYGSINDLLLALDNVPVTSPIPVLSSATVASVIPRLQRPRLFSTGIAAAAFIILVFFVCGLLPLLIYVWGTRPLPTPTPTQTREPTIILSTPSLTAVPATITPSLTRTFTKTPTEIPTNTFTPTPTPSPTSSETPTLILVGATLVPTPRIDNLVDCNSNNMARYWGSATIEIKWYWPQAIEENHYLEIRLGAYGTSQTLPALRQVGDDANLGGGNWRTYISASEIPGDGYYSWQIAYMKNGRRQPVAISKVGCFYYQLNNPTTLVPTATKRGTDK